jgi:hypothetical protein
MRGGKLSLMHSANVVKASVILLFFWPIVCEARPVRVWLPEELEAKASLVCNGTVIAIAESGIKKDFPYPNVSPPTSHEIVLWAKIKVLHVFKGQAPAEIELRYLVLQPTSALMIIDGPMHIDLQKGSRYRFFLKPDVARGEYVGVLDGEMDDNFAVEELSLGEPDDSPYLHKEEAIKVARDFLKSKNLESTVDWVHPVVNCFCENENSGTWSVLLFHLDGPTKGNVLIVIRGDRTVNLEQTRLTN